MNKELSIGFIGTGVMGKSMAGHLLSAGHQLHVFNRTRAKADALIEHGATWKDSPAEVAAQSDYVFSMVGFPKDVEATYFGENGIFASAQPGAYLIDLTTSSPQLAQRIDETAREKKMHALDAPVSGGDRGAREATLSIMVGGEKSDFETVRPLLEMMGKTIVYQGPSGSGQHTKMCNQIAIAGGIIAVCEALAYAKGAGLDAKTVLRSISGGAAGSWTLSNLAPRMIEGDFAPGFYVKHFIKDMAIAQESAEAMSLRTPALHLARALYDELAAQGFADDGTQALYKLFVARE